jgi:hypothetical protein
VGLAPASHFLPDGWKLSVSIARTSAHNLSKVLIPSKYIKKHTTMALFKLFRWPQTVVAVVVVVVDDDDDVVFIPKDVCDDIESLGFCFQCQRGADTGNSSMVGLGAHLHWKMSYWLC